MRDECFVTETSLAETPDNSYINRKGVECLKYSTPFLIIADVGFNSVDGGFTSADADFNFADADFSIADSVFTSSDIVFNRTDTHFKRADVEFNLADALFNSADAVFTSADDDFNSADTLHIFSKRQDFSAQITIEKTWAETNANPVKGKKTTQIRK